MEKGEEDFGKISKMIQKEMARFEVRSFHNVLNPIPPCSRISSLHRSVNYDRPGECTCSPEEDCL